MNSLQANKRVFGYDLLKALAMFLVVFYHFEMLDFSFEEGEYYLPNLNKIVQLITAAGVPLFFMVNGALTVHRKTTFEKVIIKAAKLVFIAIFWAFVLQWGLGGYLFGDQNPISLHSLVGSYWFLSSLAMVYVINYLLEMSPKWLRYILISAIFIMTFLNNFIWDIILYFNPEQTLPSWGQTGLFTLYGVVYTRIGAYLKNIKLNIFVCIFIFLVGLALNVFKTIVMTNYDNAIFDGVNASFPTLGALFLSIGLFCMLRDVKDNFWSSQVIKTVGINSIGVYIFHFTLIGITRKFIYKGIFHVDDLPLVLVFISVLVITIVCAYISAGIMRTPLKVLLKL